MLGVQVFTEVTVTILGAFATMAVVVMAIAFSHRKLSATIEGSLGGLKGSMSVHSNGGTSSGGGQPATKGPLVFLPIWHQFGALLPDGNPDPEQYNDCGETCCAMVIAAVRGVQLEPGFIRQELGGDRRSGLTTGPELVAALATNSVASHCYYPEAQAAFEACVISWALAHPVIALGNWLSPSSLHWMLLDNKFPGGLTFIDPWSATERRLDRGNFTANYAGTLVLIDEACHYNMRGVPTPGTGAQA
jgi:hypothetical protein